MSCSGEENGHWQLARLEICMERMNGGGLLPKIYQRRKSGSGDNGKLTIPRGLNLNLRQSLTNSISASTSYCLELDLKIYCGAMIGMFAKH